MPQLHYGNYSFAPDSVWFTISSRAVIGQTGRVNFANVVWNITGRVSGADTAEVTAKIIDLQNAMVDGCDLVFDLGSGVHSLRSADCVEGTHVLKLDFLPGFDSVRGSGAELVLRRTLNLVVAGRKIITSDTDIIAYSESFQSAGSGGPIIVPVHSLAGSVQAQQTVATTEFWTTQSGFSVGLHSLPAANTALWQSTPGVYYKPHQVRGGLYSPQHLGINVNTGWRTTWSYSCWSRVPLIGSPIPPF